MASRLLFSMQNNFTQRKPQDEGICTIAALTWAKTCLRLKRGIGSYHELGLSDHQLNALMAVWRNFDNAPNQQTAAVGLKAVGPDQSVRSLRKMQQIVGSTEPQVAVFWNSFHTMGYRIGRNGTEHEWFDNNHGLYLAKSAADMYQTMRAYMRTNYRENISGVRIVKLPD